MDPIPPGDLRDAERARRLSPPEARAHGERLHEAVAEACRAAGEWQNPKLQSGWTNALPPLRGWIGTGWRRPPHRPRLLGRFLPHSVTTRSPELKADVTTYAFPWDSRTYIRERGDDGWLRYTFIGHRIQVIWTPRSARRYRRFLEVNW